MATSGDIVFKVTSDEIITEALELLGVLGEGESPTTAQLSSSRRTLNMMTKTWQAEGLNLFAVQRLFLFPKKGQAEYPLGDTSGTNFTTSFVTSAVAVAASELDTTIELDDVTGVNAGDFIGIYTVDNVFHWAQIIGSPAGNVVNIAFGPLPADVLVGAVVYSYTAVAERPMLILEGYTHQFSGTDIPLDLIGRVDYYELANKTTEGFINQIYYDPQIDDGNLFVWPLVSDERDYLILLVQRTLFDMNTGANNPDYPQEWYMPLAYNLARYLAPKYGTPQMDYSRLMQQARELYDLARGFDTEMGTSMYLRPDTWGNDLP